MTPAVLLLISASRRPSPVQMDSGLAHVRSLLGSASESGFDDKAIKDSLWYYYFDAEKTVAWLFEERVKVEKKTAKNGERLLFFSPRFRLAFSVRVVASSRLV